MAFGGWLPSASLLPSGLIPGVNSIAGTVGHALGQVPHALGGAYNAVFNDPYIKYAGMNQMALQGIPQSGSWGNVYAQMRIPVNQLPAQHLATLRAILSAAPVNADRLSPASPQLQAIALRALNARNARLGP